MKVVLDTNILLISFKKSSPYRPIFDKLLKGKYELVFTNEILLEYIEIISQKANIHIANNLGDLLVKLPNAKKVEVRFNWNLIEADPDDNKFVDAAIAGNVEYIVTNDKHFKVLEKIPFPAVAVKSAIEFLEAIEGL